jgi:hypothetical protein
MTVPAAVSHGSARLGDVTDQWPPELIAKAAGHAQEADWHYAHKERPRSEPWTRVPDEQAARLITAAAPLIAAAERSRLAGHKSREALGRFVREVWVQWASDQADAKPSWLVVWDELEPGQREVDCRIGESVAAVIRAVEETGAQAATRDPRLLVAVLLRQLGHRATSSAPRTTTTRSCSSSWTTQTTRRDDRRHPQASTARVQHARPSRRPAARRRRTRHHGQRVALRG